MNSDSEAIVKEFDSHLSATSNRYYSDFCIGITDNIEQGLFEDHCVDKERSWWMYNKTGSVETARDVEKHYLDLGMRPGSNGDVGNNDVYVYCYVVSSRTVENYV